MAFDDLVGTLIDPKYGIHAARNYLDTLNIANAESFGGSVASSLVIGLTAADDTITQAAASVANVGKLAVISGSTADDGTYLIEAAVANTSYDLVTSAGVAFAATNTEAATLAIYDFPSLESDLNYLQTIDKQMKGTADWFTAQPSYANPDDLASNIAATFDHLKDAHTKKSLVKLSVDASPFTLATSDTGIVVTDSTAYADAGRDTGLPIGDSGAKDETNYNLTFVSIRRVDDNLPLEKADGTMIWGRLMDGATNGTGEGTDVEVKLYTGANDGTASAYTVTSDLNGVQVRVQYFKIDSIYDLSRNNMLQNVGSGYILHAGDAELADDVRDLQEFTGGADNATTPTLTNTTDFYPFSANNVAGPVNPADTDLEELANVLNNVIGDLDFSAAAGLIINNGDTDTVTDMLEDLAEAISESTTTKVHKRVTGAAIPAGTAISLPGTESYKPLSGTDDAGKWMDVYLNGVLMLSHRTDYDNDYEETSGGTQGVTAGTITFKSKAVNVGSRLTFNVRLPNS